MAANRASPSHCRSPRVRAWYHERYVAVDVPLVQVDIVLGAEGVTVTSAGG